MAIKMLYILGEAPYSFFCSFNFFYLVCFINCYQTPSSPLNNWNDIQIINEGVNLKYHGKTSEKKRTGETSHPGRVHNFRIGVDCSKTWA